MRFGNSVKFADVPEPLTMSWNQARCIWLYSQLLCGPTSPPPFMPLSG